MASLSPPPARHYIICNTHNAHRLGGLASPAGWPRISATSSRGLRRTTSPSDASTASIHGRFGRTSSALRAISPSHSFLPPCRSAICCRARLGAKWTGHGQSRHGGSIGVRTSRSAPARPVAGCSWGKPPVHLGCCARRPPPPLRCPGCVGLRMFRVCQFLVAVAGSRIMSRAA